MPPFHSPSGISRFTVRRVPQNPPGFVGLAVRLAVSDGTRLHQTSFETVTSLPIPHDDDSAAPAPEPLGATRGGDRNVYQLLASNLAGERGGFGGERFPCFGRTREDAVLNGHFGRPPQEADALLGVVVIRPARQDVSSMGPCNSDADAVVASFGQNGCPIKTSKSSQSTSIAVGSREAILAFETRDAVPRGCRRGVRVVAIASGIEHSVHVVTTVFLAEHWDRPRRAGQSHRWRPDRLSIPSAQIHAPRQRR